MSQLLVGDVLRYNKKRRFGLVPRLIRLIQGNDCVHVAIVIRGGDFPEVAEADSDFGVRVTPYEIACFKEVPKVSRINNITIDERKLYENAIIYAAGSYAFEKILDACINHAFGRLYNLFGRDYTFREFTSKNNSSRFVCSTLVSRLLSNASDQEYNPCAEPDDFTNGPWTLME